MIKNDIINEIIRTYNEINNIPHILIYGEHNCGKKKILNKLLNHIYTPSLKKLYCMYINCATCKGIKMIRDDIKEFAKQNTNIVNFKSIILYDADNLTIDAQYSLRRCIEIYSKNTRFFIVTAYKDKLLNPICSRFIQIYIPKNKYKIKTPIIQLNIKDKTIIDLVDYSDELYKNGIYGDMILKQIQKIKKERYIYIKFYYEIICQELRNERWIIFYLLCFYKNIL
jgi:DNA polymerase III delta prime subunit